MSGQAVAPVPIVALDFSDLAQALALVEQLGDQCRFYKIGSELFTAAGPEAVSRVRAGGSDVMLDLKFHDIPNTVAGGVSSARRLGVRILTIHASGGEAMIRAAADAAGSDCQVFAVTVLTSLDSESVSGVWGRGKVDVGREVVRLASAARDAGAAGVVASGSEVQVLKGALGAPFQVLVPGIRPANSDAGDQRRVVTPAEARRIGADYVIAGRAVTRAADPRAAMEGLIRELGTTPD